MNILLAHFRVGETDGVSLEMDKWKWALEASGHKVHYLAGSSGDCEAECISELHYLDDFNDKIIHNAYVKMSDYSSDSELIEAIEAQAERIADKVADIITKLDIDIIVPNNVWSLGYHLPAAIGILDAVNRTGIKAICHHHDFHWEREKYSKPTTEKVTELLDQYFPPKQDNIQHCIINYIAQEELKFRRDIDSDVVPNVFDFHSSDWKVDDYNRDLRERFGIQPNDIMFLQATRIVARKGIELAIDHIAEVAKQKQKLIGKTLYNGQTFTQESRLILTFAGMSEEESYLDKLKEKAKQQGVELLFINDAIAHSRSDAEGEKVYSLWDAYAHADIITYPSLLEGWGNQFLEGLIAKLPMIVYRYPVYATDIAANQFDIIDLGDTHQLDAQGLAYIDSEQNAKSAEQTIKYLTDRETRQKEMERNYQIGLHSYSYPVLKQILDNIFSA
ncbi:glycosyltransferase family 4 protein [Vibrio sp. SCSIO 43137]|uniref:glycosyltransferase family 4 protein n=1 Tax=Vibrio sp. SCSIO 43137 TaxID=3021011 RepID=UPI002307B048|nr:glycosyltransferase family 4 protein [Vibrio sp. SCSIO 43137]WCE28689.1 glycosyltransferase family 4 protein [Vibrio sp. SCSIO 43137]